jgi:hypothetical protein
VQALFEPPTFVLTPDLWYAQHCKTAGGRTGSHWILHVHCLHPCHAAGLFSSGGVMAQQRIDAVKKLLTKHAADEVHCARVTGVSQLAKVLLPRMIGALTVPSLACTVHCDWHRQRDQLAVCSLSGRVLFGV